jgi:hypothetical protein
MRFWLSLLFRLITPATTFNDTTFHETINHKLCEKLSPSMLDKPVSKSEMLAVRINNMVASPIRVSLFANTCPGELYTLEHGLSVRDTIPSHRIRVFFLTRHHSNSPTVDFFLIPRLHQTLASRHSSRRQVRESKCLVPFTLILSLVLWMMSRLANTGPYSTLRR